MNEKQSEPPTSTKGIMKKLDKILQTTYETLDLLKSIEKKESEVLRNGRLESVI